MGVVTDMFEDLISLLFPRICYACGDRLMKNEDLICTNCFVNIHRTGFHLTQENIVEKTFWGRCKLEKVAVFSIYNKDSSIRKLVHNMKYRGVKEIGSELGRIYGNDLVKSDFLDGIDLIVPVPLHPSKERIRGFNQSAEIAEGLSASTGIPAANDIMTRASFSHTQTKRKRVDRWANVEGIFGVPDYSRIEGKHLLLVDDVITTGATIESCASELLKGRDVKVSVVALAATIN
jgi:ComF family protein